MKSHLSPKDLGDAIGVSESSLKRWADQGYLEVARTAGGHRRIHLGEAIRFIRAAGFQVVRPQCLGLDDLDDAGAVPADTADAFDAALADGRAARARGLLLARYLAGTTLAELIDDVIAPAMRRIGRMWLHDEDIGMLVEHRATDICTQALDQVRTLHAVAAGSPVAIGGAPAADRHSLPSLMAAALLTTEGWSAINLGGETPPRVLAEGARDGGAEFVWLAVSTDETGGAARSAVAAVVDALSAAGWPVPVVVGGPGVESVDRTTLEPAHVVDSMRALAEHAGSMSGAGGLPGAGEKRWNQPAATPRPSHTTAQRRPPG